LDFSNTIIFMTSNLATDTIMQMGQGPVRPEADEIATAIRPELNKWFKPALVARMTLVPFYPIDPETMGLITRLKLGSVGKRLFESHRMAFAYDDEVITQIAERCTEADTGARNIDHIIRGNLLPRISSEILIHMAADTMPSKLSIHVGDDGDFALEFTD
jgi:type VI secretion system protein VasG